MSILSGVLDQGVLGVITGLFGTVLTTFMNLKAQKVKNQHELDMLKANTEAMLAEAEMNIKVSENQLKGELERLDAEIYKESIQQANTPAIDVKLVDKLFASKWTMPFGVVLVFLLGLVEFTRSIMRPGLTAYLVFLTSWLTLHSVRIIQQKQELLSALQALELFQQVVGIIVYLTVSTVTWWFGDRRVAKFLYRLNDGNVREK